MVKCVVQDQDKKNNKSMWEKIQIVNVRKKERRRKKQQERNKLCGIRVTFKER